MTALMVGMVRPVSAVMWALQVLPARKVHGVSVDLPVPMARMARTARMVQTGMMGVRLCLCTVLGAACL